LRNSWEVVYEWSVNVSEPDVASACPGPVTCPWAGLPEWRRMIARSLYRSGSDLQQHITGQVELMC